MIESVLRIDASRASTHFAIFGGMRAQTSNDAALLTMSGSVRSSFDSPRRQLVLNSPLAALLREMNLRQVSTTCSSAAKVGFQGGLGHTTPSRMGVHPRAHVFWSSSPPATVGLSLQGDTATLAQRRVAAMLATGD